VKHFDEVTVKIIVSLFVASVFLFSACSSNNYFPGAIDVLEPVSIGGMKQWMMANGRNEDLPVLLWLHGGPGAAQMPIARYFNNNLEEEFIVVQWDQRGAGKSNPKDFDESTMTFERFVLDVYEMTQYLKERFDKEKIYLLGHSWGTQIGFVAAHRYPENYIAYIGVSQVSHGDSSQLYAYEELKKRIGERGRKRDIQKLEKLNGPPYREHADYVTFARMLGKYDMNMDVGMWKLARVALRSDAYSIGNLRRWLRGANRGSGPMWDETQGMDMLEWVPEITIPCFFITGTEDYNTPLVLMDRIMERLDAPAGKELIIFENAAHTPFFADPDRFYAELKRIKEKTIKFE